MEEKEKTQIKLEWVRDKKDKDFFKNEKRGSVIRLSELKTNLKYWQDQLANVPEPLDEKGLDGNMLIAVKEWNQINHFGFKDICGKEIQIHIDQIKVFEEM